MPMREPSQAALGILALAVATESWLRLSWPWLTVVREPRFGPLSILWGAAAGPRMCASACGLAVFSVSGIAIKQEKYNS